MADKSIEERVAIMEEAVRSLKSSSSRIEETLRELGKAVSEITVKQSNDTAVEGDQEKRSRKLKDNLIVIIAALALLSQLYGVVDKVVNHPISFHIAIPGIFSHSQEITVYAKHMQTPQDTLLPEAAEGVPDGNQ